MYSKMEAVAEAQRMLKLDDEEDDHWHPSDEFQREMLRLMNDQVGAGVNFELLSNTLTFECRNPRLPGQGNLCW